MFLQAIDEDAGDPRAFVGLAGLLLDDRGQRDQLAGRLDRQIGRPLRPDLVDHLGLSFAHARQLGLARVAALEQIGVRQQRALARLLLDVADEHVVVAKSLDDLIAGQTLGNGELVLHDFVRDQLGLDLMQTDAGFEGVFAALQRAAAAVEHRHRREPQRAFDDAGAFELLADRAGIVLAFDDDDLVLAERARLARFDHRPDEYGHPEQADREHEGQQAGKAGKTEAARPAGRLGGRRLAGAIAVAVAAVAIAWLATTAKEAHALRGLRGGAGLGLVALICPFRRSGPVPPRSPAPV